MASSDHYRSAQVHADGRNLTGVALPFGVIARVVDGPRGKPYREGFHRASFGKSLNERAAKPFPLLMMHPHSEGARTSPVPLGPVTFEASTEGLMYRARLSSTRDADEALALIGDGVLGDVSVGFHCYRSRPATDHLGPWVERMEASPFELSLAVTGTGLYPTTMAVRAAATIPTGTPKLDALRASLALLRPY